MAHNDYESTLNYFLLILWLFSLKKKDAVTVALLPNTGQCSSSHELGDVLCTCPGWTSVDFIKYQIFPNKHTLAIKCLETAVLTGP